MQKKSIPAKFLFRLRKLSLNVSTAMDVIIRIKRNQKFSYSKTHRYDPQVPLDLSQILEFKTTIDKTVNGFQSKTLMLQVNGRNPENKQEKFQLVANIELGQIAEAGSVNKTFRVKSKTDSGSVQVECRAELVDNDILPRQQSSTSLQHRDKQSSKQAPIQRMRSMQNIPRKKEKNLVISDKTSVNQYDPDSPPGPKSRTFVSKSSRELGTVMEQNEGESAISDKKSIALMSEDNKSFKSKTETEYVTGLNNLNQQAMKMREEIKELKSELEDCKQKETKGRRRIKELEQKIELFKITDQKGEHGSEEIIKRLHEEIEAKVKEIRAANEESDKAMKLRRKEEEVSSELRKELGQLKLQKQKILFEYKYSSNKQRPTKDIPNTANQDIVALQLYYQEQIQELKQELKQKTKLLTAVQPSSTTNINDSQCFSRQCEQTKKDHQKEIKKLHKRIQQLTTKLQTKDKLLSNYDQMQDQRKNEYNKGGVHKEFQKWKAERLILEQEIEQLKSISNSGFRNNKQLSSIQEELVTYKVERENMTKQMEGLRKNLGVISKEREKLDEKYLSIERQLIDQKQKLIHLLNAVQEIGGMQMFDEISKFIE